MALRIYIECPNCGGEVYIYDTGLGDWDGSCDECGKKFILVHQLVEYTGQKRTTVESNE